MYYIQMFDGANGRWSAVEIEGNKIYKAERLIYATVFKNRNRAIIAVELIAKKNNDPYNWRIKKYYSRKG